MKMTLLRSAVLLTAACLSVACTPTEETVSSVRLDCEINCGDGCRASTQSCENACINETESAVAEFNRCNRSATSCDAAVQCAQDHLNVAPPDTNNTNNATNNATNNSTNNATNNNTTGETNNDEPLPPIEIEMTWDTNSVGVGVHLAHELAVEDSQPDVDEDGEPDPWLHPIYDFYYGNSTPDWGEPGLRNDPRPGPTDNLNDGPQVVRLDVPERGVTYRLGVEYTFNNNGPPNEWPVTVTLTVRVDGIGVEELTATLRDHPVIWDAATITDGVVTRVSTLNGGSRVIAYPPLEF